MIDYQFDSGLIWICESAEAVQWVQCREKFNLSLRDEAEKKGESRIKQKYSSKVQVPQKCTRVAYSTWVNVLSYSAPQFIGLSCCHSPTRLDDASSSLTLQIWPSNVSHVKPAERSVTDSAARHRHVQLFSGLHSYGSAYTAVAVINKLLIDNSSRWWGAGGTDSWDPPAGWRRDSDTFGVCWLRWNLQISTSNFSFTGASCVSITSHVTHTCGATGALCPLFSGTWTGKGLWAGTHFWNF